ncbi:unnamed protein product [Gordionus sp. m RMFG-2023]
MKCDSNETPNPKEIRHYRLTMWPADTGFCSDETDTCESLKPLGYCAQQTQRLSCLKTCGVCKENEIFEPPCQFPSSMQGNWLIPGTDKEIKIYNSSFKHPEFSLPFQCVAKYIPKIQSSLTKSYERMPLPNNNITKNSYDSLNLTEQLDNYNINSRLQTYVIYSKFDKLGHGSCRPRFTCLQFIELEPNKLTFRLSLSSDRIPIVEESLCAETRFLDDYPPYSNRYRNRDMKLAMATSGVHIPVKCKLNSNFQMSLLGMENAIQSAKCDVDISDCNDLVALRINGTNGCLSEVIQGEHTCLFSNDLEPDLQKIILTQNDAGNILCWYFENLDTFNTYFRVIVTSNIECNRHSYGMYMKFPEITKPDFIFIYNTESGSKSEKCEVLKKNTSDIFLNNTLDNSPITTKNMEIVKERNQMENLEFKPISDRIDVNEDMIVNEAAQQGQSPFMHANIDHLLNPKYYYRSDQEAKKEMDAKSFDNFVSTPESKTYNFNYSGYDSANQKIKTAFISEPFDDHNQRNFNVSPFSDYNLPKDITTVAILDSPNSDLNSSKDITTVLTLEYNGASFLNDKPASKKFQAVNHIPAHISSFENFNIIKAENFYDYGNNYSQNYDSDQINHDVHLPQNIKDDQNLTFTDNFSTYEPDRFVFTSSSDSIPHLDYHKRGRHFLQRESNVKKFFTILPHIVNEYARLNLSYQPLILDSNVKFKDKIQSVSEIEKSTDTSNSPNKYVIKNPSQSINNRHILKDKYLSNNSSLTKLLLEIRNFKKFMENNKEISPYNKWLSNEYAWDTSTNKFNISTLASSTPEYFANKQEYFTPEQKHPILEKEHYILGQENSTLKKGHSTLELDHSTFERKHSILGEEHSTLGQEHSTFGQEHSTLKPEFYTLKPEYLTTPKKAPKNTVVEDTSEPLPKTTYKSIIIKSSNKPILTTESHIDTATSAYSMLQYKLIKPKMPELSMPTRPPYNTHTGIILSI